MGLVPDIFVAPVALNLTVPLLLVKTPLVNAGSPSISRIPDVAVKLVPFNVKFPPIVILDEPPRNWPAENVASFCYGDGMSALRDDARISGIYR